MNSDDHNGDGPSSVFYDHGAEAAVLGRMLLDAALISDAEAIVETRSFHKPAHQVLFEALTGLREANQPTDPLSLLAHLAAQGQIRQIPDNGMYVHTLLEHARAPGDIKHFAGIVADRAVLRDLDLELGAVRATIRAGGTARTEDLVERIRTMVSDLSQRVAAAGVWKKWSEMTRPGMDTLEHIGESGEAPGIPTGLPALDKVIHGLQDSRLIVVAGPPGSGKSTLGAGNFVRSAAFTHKIPTALVSMEMPEQEVFNRLACAEAGVSAQDASEGKLSERDWVKLANMCGETDDAPLWVCDAKNQTFADIRVRARRLQQEHGIRLLVVDYLALIEVRSNAPRHQQIDELARQFHNLAGELKIPVVLLAQTNRNASQRADKRPQLTDLKESGGIEAHADVVIFVHRPEMFDKDKQVGEAVLVIAKNRAGGTPDVTVAAQLHLNRFASMALPERN